MTKKSSKIKFVLVSIIVAIGIALSVFSFAIPFTTSNFNGFANSISLGMDIGGGYSAVYDVKIDEGKSLEAEMTNSISLLKDILAGQGYSDANVFRQGDSQIRLNISKHEDEKTLISTLGDASDIYIRGSQTTEHTDNEIVGSDIKTVYAKKQQTSQTDFSWGVVIEFKQDAEIGKSGSEKYKELTQSVSEGSQTIYIYLDDTLFTPISGITEAQSSGILFLSGGSITSKETASQFALKVLVGTLETKLTQGPNSVSTIPATFGENFILFALIAFGILVILFVFVLVCKFKDLGLLSILSVLIYGVLLVFFLQAVPLVLLTFGGIIAIALGFALLFICHYILFNNISKEYAYGKKIPLSFKSGYKKSVLPIVDINVCAIIASFVMWFLGDVFTMGFGVIISISCALVLFTTLIVTRGLTKMYLPLNSVNAKKLGFKRGENVNEI